MTGWTWDFVALALVPFLVLALGAWATLRASR